jgi:hypothetical protein
MNYPIRKATKWMDKLWTKLVENELLSDFIIIFAVYLFIAYPTEMVFATETPLGKLVAVFIIIYYASLDFTYGVFACGLILYYYQLDLVESLIKIEINEKMAENLETMNTQLKQSTADSKPPTPQVEPYCGPSHDLYRYEPMKVADFNENILLQNAREEFRKENCKNGELTLKGLAIKPEMSDHVFREIKFPAADKCNPCDKSCKFSIVESRIRGETEIRKQVSGREVSMVDSFTEKINSAYEPVVSMFGNAYTSLASFL